MLTGSYTDKGTYRKKNEDFVLCGSFGCHTFLILADGLGGMPYGEVASRMACEEAAGILEDGWTETADAEDRRSFLLRLFNTVNGKILRRCIDEPEYWGMCTTLTVAVLTDERLCVGHVGDSRAYLVRDDGVIRVTEDHNRAARLVAEGRITEEEALRHPGRNMLTMVVGENTYLDPYVREEDLNDGDCVLLVSDGVYSVSENEAFAGIRDHKDDPGAFCRDLVLAAVNGGSFDNCTAAAAVVGGKDIEK